MTHRLSRTAVLTMLVACVGMTAHAKSLEEWARTEGRQWDLTAQLDRTAPVKGTGMDFLGSIDADAGLTFNRAPSSQAGQLKKEVPTPVNQNANKGLFDSLRAVATLFSIVAIIVGGIAIGARAGGGGPAAIGGLIGYFVSMLTVLPLSVKIDNMLIRRWRSRNTPST